ncbi:MAG TPA: 2'-5' RNA ligase family protein [Candidatus Sulfotelmatobacter sp.]|nr:2'-5' RNA ligase family protein [Candidatus Sulfotelmatobacter sp.]
MSDLREFLSEHYACLWQGAIGEIRAGKVEIDAILASGQADRRRGLTVIARPSPEVQERVMGFLEALRRIDPEQYYYEPSELHVTFLSLFTATVEHERFFARREAYLSAVDAALSQVPAFKIEFTGVTVSRGAVMIQGYPQNGILNTARDRLRAELRQRGLVEGLDGRYRLETAHMTAARFRRGLQNSHHFAVALETHRHHVFGQSHVSGLDLVRNDWYMSRQNVCRMKAYELIRQGRVPPRP